MRNTTTTILLLIICLLLLTAACEPMPEWVSAENHVSNSAPALAENDPDCASEPDGNVMRCSSTADVTVVATKGTSSLDVENAIYRRIYDIPIQLTDGFFEGPPYQEDGASRPTVRLLDPHQAYGDLNGDGIDDAAVILVENSGGSGTFYYLAPILGKDSRNTRTMEHLINGVSLLVGDRFEVRSISINHGHILLEGAIHRPEDGLCCPTHRVRQTYTLQDGLLVLVSEEEL